MEFDKTTLDLTTAWADRQWTALKAASATTHESNVSFKDIWNIVEK